MIPTPPPMEYVQSWSRAHAAGVAQLRRATAEAAALHLSVDALPLMTAWAVVANDLVPVFSETIGLGAAWLLDSAGRLDREATAERMGAIVAVVLGRIGAYLTSSASGFGFGAPLAAFTCRYRREGDGSVRAVGTDIVDRIWHSDAGARGVWGTDSEPSPGDWADLTELSAAAVTFGAARTAASLSAMAAALGLERGGDGEC